MPTFNKNKKFDVRDGKLVSVIPEIVQPVDKSVLQNHITDLQRQLDAIPADTALKIQTLQQEIVDVQGLLAQLPPDDPHTEDIKP